MRRKCSKSGALSRRQKAVNLLLALGTEHHENLTKVAMHSEARKRGWNVLDISLTGDVLPPDYEPQLAIVLGPPDMPLYSELRARGVHIVRHGLGGHPLDPLVPAVLGDREAEGRLAAEHFAERGFRSLGIVQFFKQMSQYDKAFRDHAIELGCQFHELNMLHMPAHSHDSPAEIYQKQSKTFSEWVAKVPQPLGILQRDDLSAALLCHFCMQAGIRVPDQVALLGRSNDIVICDFAPVRLSSIHLDTEGRVAAVFGLLDDLHAGRKIAHSPILIPPRGVVTRESTDVRASQNPDVAKALRHMWDHYDDFELSVDKIAAVVGFSRRKLERLFRAELDQSVNNALLKRRLERCCEMLITTDLNVSDLCFKIGLRSRGYLARAFKLAYGMTLKQYRLLNRHAR